MAEKAKQAAEATEKDAEKSAKSTSEKTDPKKAKKSTSKDSGKKSSGKASKSSERRKSDENDKSGKNKPGKDKPGKSDKSGKNDEAATQLHAPGSNRWVVPTFVTLALLGVLWMVVFYISSTANIDIPVMSDIGYWNLAIGMGLLAVSLGLTTQWK